MSKKECFSSFAAAYKKSLNVKPPRQMEHIGHPTAYADIVTLWTRDREFLDERGLPRALSFSGRNEFVRLVRKAAPEVNARKALKVLVAYGNVRKDRRGKYGLVRPFFFASSHTKVAFEPVAFFLSDASSTLTRILRRRRDSRTPELFWRKVESASISDADADEFNTFARERSMLFLEELDDWLEAHSRNEKKPKAGHRRVGLGLFSIYSDLERPNSKR